MKIKILGKCWELRFVPAAEIMDGRNYRGSCDPPDHPGKEIKVASSLKDEERLEVLIHEMLHAAGWHIDESFVSQFAADAARLLWKLGYKRSEDIH